MKLKKMILFGCVAAVAAISINSTSPAPDGGDPGGTGSGTRNFETDPPKAVAIWVQRLATVRDDGSNVLMRIQYEQDTTLPSTLSLHYSSGSVVDFHDDGEGADSAAHDFIYSAYLQENISAFTSGISAMEANLAAQGSFIEFEGHNGHVETAIPHFDLTRFNAGQITPLSMHLIQGSDCGSDLLRQNSLFITDLSVVEDNARAYNVADGSWGNADGVWTFGSMMRNAAAPAGKPTATFMKEWIRNWTHTVTVNGQDIAARTGIFGYVIQPWLHRAQPLPSNAPTAVIDESNWETAWNAVTDTTSLIRNAPFRLMAIVNRIDLRGNFSYYGNVSNAGETRFIFTLIDLSTGQTPLANHNDNADGDLVDWRGMNVILEYGNPQQSFGDIRDFAQSWLDLSALTLGSTAYDSALEDITHQVIDAYAAPWRPNQSALLRIRTDERALYPTCNPGSRGGCTESWELSNWELRQFQIDPGSHFLTQVPVSNTPVATANMAGYQFYEAMNTADGRTTMPYAGSSSVDPTDADALMDWMFTPVVKNALLRQTHVIPAPMLAGSAIEYMDYTHFWNVDWEANTPHYVRANYNFATGIYPSERKMRHNLSLQTCQGCHTGETKTVFTQMRPLNYGVSARYWLNPTPDYVHSVPALVGAPPSLTNGQDPRFTRQEGTTHDPIHNSEFPNYSESDVATRAYFPIVSAFLTGRDYKGSNGSPTFADDNFDPIHDDPSDNTMNGLFFVADPMNNTTPSSDGPLSYLKPDSIWGFNDLLMRKNSLCQFLAPNANSSVILQTTLSIAHAPLPLD